MTLQQSVVFDFIARFITRHNHSPSYEEIAAGCGYTSLATIHNHMLALEMHGKIRRLPNKARSVEVLKPPCAYRPIAEMHEDHGPCVVIDIEDPGRMAIAHVCQLSPSFDEVLEWATHFAPAPSLTSEQAEDLIAQMRNGGGKEATADG